MHIILIIVAALIVIGICGALVQWIKENIGVIIVIVIGIVLLCYLGIGTVLKIGLALFVLLLIFGAISSYISDKNEKHLKEYLKNNCMQLGYMNEASWKRELQEFASKSYTTSFEEITRNFAGQVEDKYITNDPNLSWLDPAANYLKKNFIADVFELEQIKSPGLIYTHSTTNGNLIDDAMDMLSKNKVINGKHLIQKVSLQPEAVCENHNFMSVEEIPDYYMHLYTINDYFRERSISKEESNMISEEISLDDL